MTKKTTFPQVVPWRNKEEWIQVYEKMYSTQQDDLEWAVNQVSVWQARSPNSSLLGVETTAALVRARILDLNQTTKESIFQTQNEVSMVYAMAIVRFVNLVCETGQSRAHITPIRNIARNFGIPEWLVNLRHSSTHKHSIPSLDMLRTGSSLALEWLRLNYWEKEVENFEDLVLQGTDINSSIFEEIGTCLHEFQKIQYSLIYDEKSKLTKINRNVLHSAVKPLRIFLKGHPTTFIQVLSESGYLIPKYHHLEALLKPGESSFLDSNSIQLPHSLEKFWTPVFHLFNQSDHLHCLLRHLLEPRFPDDEFSERLSAAWALHILNIISSQESGVFLFKPSLNWLQLLEIALKKPSQYSPQVLAAICQNVALSEEVKQALMSLVAIFLGSVTSTAIPNKITNTYKMEDLMKHLPQKSKKLLSDPGAWKSYSGKNDWQNMPLGFVLQAPTVSEVTIALEPSDETITESTAANPIITEPSDELEDMCLADEEQYEESVQQTSFQVKEADLSAALIFM